MHLVRRNRSRLHTPLRATEGCLDIVFQHQTGLRANGAMTVEQRFHFPVGIRTAGIRFRPGMAGPFLRIAPAELTDGAAAFPHAPLDRIQNSFSLAHGMDLLAQALVTRAKPLNPVQRAIEALTAAHGNLDCDYCARHANLSPRQFRRCCQQESGVTPKLLSRILRFRYASQLARQNNHWSTITADAGYFDQAHLIRDFRCFTGQTPVSVFSNTPAPSAVILD